MAFDGDYVVTSFVIIHVNMRSFLVLYKCPLSIIIIIIIIIFIIIIIIVCIFICVITVNYFCYLCFVLKRTA